MHGLAPQQEFPPRHLSRLEGRVGINAGFLVGHSALRRCVMGERSVGKEATEAELNSMRELLAESLAQGGLGFSSSWAQTHNDGDGQPVPSRHATRDELVSLAGVLRDHPGTTLEFIPTVGRFTQEKGPQAVAPGCPRVSDDCRRALEQYRVVLQGDRTGCDDLGATGLG